LNFNIRKLYATTPILQDALVLAAGTVRSVAMLFRHPFLIGMAILRSSARRTSGRRGSRRMSSEALY
jgi:hypothetical protein